MAPRLNPFSRNRREHRFADRTGAHQVLFPHSDPKRSKQLRTHLDAWQEKILVYAGIVPEVMTGYSFVHNVIDRVTFEIERFDRTENEWVTDNTPAINGIERRLNHAFRAGRAAALLHLIEEAFILVTRCDDNGFRFETLSPTEIAYRNNRNEKRIIVDGTKEKWVAVDDDTTTIRVYTPDPANRMLAGGPHKSLLGLLEMMALELSRDQAEAISVLAGNGILYIPTEILPDESDSLDVSDTPGSRQAFDSRLEEAMTATIIDRQRADAIVPITLYGPAEYAKDIRHIIPGRDENAHETGERMDRYIQRYARDIDLPAQIILGLGDTNHWTDWKVDENTWAYHLEPRAQRIADAIYKGLVDGIICNLGLDPSDYRLVPNPSKAVAQQDKSGTATDAYKLGVLKPESYVEAIGFDPSDMRPDAEETLLLLLAGSNAPTDEDSARSVGQPNPPDRSAAARAVKPQTILRQASKVANQQQRQLDAFYRRLLAKVAADAARAGNAARLQSARDKKAAQDPIAFEGYEPGVYFAKYRAALEKGTIDQLFTMLRRIATLTGLDYPFLRGIWETEFAARALAVSRAAESNARKVEAASFKSGKPAKITEATIRTMTSTANGGATENATAVSNTNRPTHAAADPSLREPLKEAVGGEFATQYTWVHDEPTRPYPAHLALDGRKWFTWQEFDVLDHSGDTFPDGNVYFPGDHDGCLCEYAIEFMLMSDATGG